MKFRTAIEPDPPPFRIHPGEAVLTAGSCFAVHIGEYLKDHFFPVSVNPLGTLFNPRSVRDLLWRAWEGRPFEPEDFFRHEGRYKNFDLHSSFARPTLEESLKVANAALEEVNRFTRRAGVLILTYGTAQIWELEDSGRPVANCHKQPASRFRKRMLDTGEIRDLTAEIYRAAKKLNPNMRFVFSVSPVRYLQDGMPANSRSKGRLVDALLTFAEQNPRDTYYFPSFEIFNDDLRDYRFYASDLIHPGEQGIAYVREIFTDLFFDDEGRQMWREARKIRRMLDHRPMGGEAAAREWRAKVRDRLVRFASRYPGMDVPLSGE
ncbi:MAG: GSCFA domain-containing protein [Chlorobi bacterium]|nr:GSCFA domain-containing protein [Chlorobiota bacterium]